MNLYREYRLSYRIVNRFKTGNMLMSPCGKCQTLYTQCQNSNYLLSINSLDSQRRQCSSKPNNDRESRLVYYGTLTSQIRAVKLFSLLSSAAGLGFQPVLIEHSSNLGTPLTVALFGAVGFFTFVTPILLHIITRKYVTHLYFNPEQDQYTAVTYNFFLRKKEVTFSVNEIDTPEVPGMFMSFRAKGVPLFVDPRLFESRHHYARLMGYDKPIDFKLSKPANEENKQ